MLVGTIELTLFELRPTSNNCTYLTAKFLRCEKDFNISLSHLKAPIY